MIRTDNDGEADNSRPASPLTVGGQDLCRVHVRPSRFPVEATVTVAKDGQHQQVTHLYGRFNNQTRAITDPDESEKFKLQIWG